MKYSSGREVLAYLFDEEDAAAIISNLTAHGFVIAPTEPTDKMLSAGGYHDADIVYRAMISASQEPKP